MREQYRDVIKTYFRAGIIENTPQTRLQPGGDGLLPRYGYPRLRGAGGRPVLLWITHIYYLLVPLLP